MTWWHNAGKAIGLYHSAHGSITVFIGCHVLSHSIGHTIAKRFAAHRSKCPIGAGNLLFLNLSYSHDLMYWMGDRWPRTANRRNGINGTRDVYGPLFT